MYIREAPQLVMPSLQWSLVWTWLQSLNPRSLNVWFTSRASSALTCINGVASPTVRLQLDIGTAIARRSFTRHFADRDGTKPRTSH
ncbi:hypothetical protein LFM09_49275 [Lentzea alba]|uniref:hypothetical protein n=1 Tax=Lentzea alba TaxID=2714351 RepID=UPI0039BFE2A6